MVERSTVLLQRTTDGQASASLRLANNRLSELEAGLSLPGRAYNPALNALLEEDKGLADLTPHLPAPACEQVARQVAAHAGQLETLAQGNHEPQVATALLPAAVETNALAETILEHNDKTAPTPGDPTPTRYATPAAKKLATTAPVLSVTTQGASTRSQSATSAPSIGTLSKRGAAAGRAAASTSGASPARVAPSASHLQRPLDSPKHGGPQSLPPVKDLPPTPGKASTAKLTSPPAQPSPPSPAPPGIPAPQPAAPPALERPVHRRPVSLPAFAPEPPAPYASGPAIRGLSEAPSSSVIGKGPAVKMQAPEAKQKGRATSRPTQSVRSIER
jgi:hypothetical protein